MAVRKREWTRKDGTPCAAWVADYKDRNGKRHIETFDFKKDADARLAEIKQELVTGVHTPRRKSITVAQACENWIAEGKKNNLERATLKQYRGHVDNHLTPHIGHLKLSDLSTPAVAVYDSALHEAGMTAELRRKVLTSLSSVLRVAQQQGFINRNAAEAYRVKVSRRTKRKLRVGVDIPTPDEVRAFGSGIRDLGDKLFFVAAAYAGLRASELRGLPWRDVDLDGCKLHITQRADVYGVIGPPKSESARRTIPIPAAYAEALCAWRKVCPKGELDLVFPTSRGTVQSLANIRTRKLVPYMKKANLVDESGKPRYCGMHIFRHYFASVCAAPVSEGGHGFTLKRTQELMGHSSLALTSDRYSHLFPSDDVAAKLNGVRLPMLDATQMQHAHPKVIAA